MMDVTFSASHGTDDASALDIARNGLNADKLYASDPVDLKGFFVTDRLDIAQSYAESRQALRGLEGSGSVLSARDSVIGGLLEGDGTKLNEAFIPIDRFPEVPLGAFQLVAPGH